MLELNNNRKYYYLYSAFKTSKMRVALHNIHLLPNLQFHGYIYELLKLKLVTVLYFSDATGVSYLKSLISLIRHENIRKNYREINWSDFDFVFTAHELNKKADVLLNLNLMCLENISPEFSSSVAKFDGLKIFHVGDYFWYRPGSETYRLLQSVGVDHLFGYAMHDRYCSYFQNYFPEYKGKVWGIPFGYAPRFVSQKPFAERLQKVVAVGSVNPLRPLHEPIINYRETADFFPDENWFHKFRRQLVLNKSNLSSVMDIMLPKFPKIKDFKYDLVAKFNNYKLFTSCESLFNFPPAKLFEGIACGSVAIISDDECFKEYGFIDGENCIVYNKNNIDHFEYVVKKALNEPIRLSEIEKKAHDFVTQNYNHKMVAKHIIDTIKYIYMKDGKVLASELITRI